jgi:hypothetical protein
MEWPYVIETSASPAHASDVKQRKKMTEISLILLQNDQALAPLGRGGALKRDDGLKLRKAWPTEQPQRLSSRALFGVKCDSSVFKG